MAKGCLMFVQHAMCNPIAGGKSREAAATLEVKRLRAAAEADPWLQEVRRLYAPPDAMPPAKGVYKRTAAAQVSLVMCMPTWAV